MLYADTVRFTRLKNKMENISTWEDELKLTHVELFYFFHFMCVAANASKLFFMAYLANIERFFYNSNLSF